MNAKELFELYRPLWDKVPETRPRPKPLSVYGIEYMDAHPSEDVEAGWYWRDNIGFLGDPLDEMAVAALCRATVENWLWTQAETFRIVPACGFTDGQWYVQFTSDRPQVEGPTIHHALVSAALAVAGSKT